MFDDAWSLTVIGIANIPPATLTFLKGNRLPEPPVIFYKYVWSFIDMKVVDGNLGSVNSGMSGTPSFVKAQYTDAEYQQRNKRIYPRTDRGAARPPVYLAFFLGSGCHVSFVISCVTLKGRGNAFYCCAG